jgi:hypothetical protein
MATKNKLGGPSRSQGREKRWLEEVSSKDRFSSAARWWEDVIQADGTLGRLRRSEVIGTVAE